MIIKKQIKQLEHWLKGGYIYEDSEGSGFYVNIEADIGEHKFLAIPARYVGIFLPIEHDEECNIGVCSGYAFTKRKICSERAKQPCKLYKLKKMHIYEIAHHDDTLMSAITFAAFHHKYKLLLDDSAYLTHLIEVVKIVEKVGRTKDLCTLKSALLHDILNDSHVSKKSLKLLFGKKVAGIVSELTNKKSATVVNKHEDSINKLQLASNEAKLIKLAALSSNLTLIPNWHHSGLEEYLELSKTEALICKPASDDLYRYFAKRFYAIKAVRPQL